MKNNKKLKIVSVVFLFVILISMILYNNDNFDSDIECINNYVGYNYQVEDVIFKYESEKKEIVLYSSNNGTFFNCLLDKRKIFNRTVYRLDKNSNTPPITWYKEWVELDKKTRYIFLDYEKDIEKVDCNGFEPVGTKIHYRLLNGDEESCWIYVIDETKQEKKN